jgi:hypothetical protein
VTPSPGTLAAIGYLRAQPEFISVLVEHDPGFHVGEIGYLERSNSQGLLIVARIRSGTDDLSDGPWFLSARVNHVTIVPMSFERAKLSEVSLVRHPADLGTKPFCWASDDPGQPSMLLFWRGAWDRGVEQIARRKYAYRRSDHLTIVDMDALNLAGGESTANALRA